MAYFPHAFKKTLLVQPAGFVVAGATSALTGGQFGFFSPKTWTAVPLVNATVADNPQVILAQGSYHPNDKIGSNGGYKESIKSKGINPRYVHRFYKVGATTPLNQILRVGYDGTNAASAPGFSKNKTYSLRVDLKGSPVLRTLNRNAYIVADANTGCVDYCADPCADAARVDPVGVFVKWANYINEDPIFKNFVSAVVKKDVATVMTAVNLATYVDETLEATILAQKACIEFTVAYSDTTFSNCSFDVRDHSELEAMNIQATLIDEGNTPCSFVSLVQTELQAARQRQGSGETLIRELIQDARYRQENFSFDVRVREIEGQDATIMNIVTRSANYDHYFILHSVPRKANPSSTLDSDQYLIQISVAAGTDLSAFTNWFNAYLLDANTGVQLEDLS